MIEKKAVLSLGTTIILLSVVAFSVKGSSVVTVQVSPLSEQMLIFNLQTGQKFTGSLAISGGQWNEIDFWITDHQGTTVLNLSTVSQGRIFDFTAQASGAYIFHFGNSFWLLSSKTVNLTYDIGLPSIFGIDFVLFLIIIGYIVVFLLLIVRSAIMRYRKKNLSKTHAPKQVVAKNVAIALGIICIILAVGLVGAILGLQNQVNDLTNTLNIGKSLVWVNNQTVSQAAGSYYSLDISGIAYAGYISVDVQSSTTNDTYVRIIYTVYKGGSLSSQINYDNQTDVGTGGTVSVPILPSSVVEVRVGNSNLIDRATETVTITYYY